MSQATLVREIPDWPSAVRNNRRHTVRWADGYQTRRHHQTAQYSLPR